MRHQTGWHPPLLGVNILGAVQLVPPTEDDGTAIRFEMLDSAPQNGLVCGIRMDNDELICWDISELAIPIS